MARGRFISALLPFPTMKTAWAFGSSRFSFLFFFFFFFPVFNFVFLLFFRGFSSKSAHVS